MSLKIWLPFMGDLKNYGTQNLPNTSVNSFTYGAGKIGQCASGRVAWILPTEILDNTWSVAMWVRPESLGSNNNILFCKNGTAATDCQIYFSIISTTQLNIGVNGPSSSVTATGQTFTLNKWYHVAATYDGQIASVYLNGQLLKSGTVTTEKPTGRLNMNINGRCTNASNTGSTGHFTGAFNDFRLYDHCLSPLEVKEISQGLILHYKLSSSNLINKSKLTANMFINSSGNNSSTSNWYASDYIVIQPGHTYQTFDLSHGGSNTCVAFYDKNKTFVRSVTIVANENLTLTAGDNEVYMRVSIRNIAGELAIAKVVEVFTTIQDSSGYNHNGTILNAVTLSSDSPRYNISTNLSAGNSAINCGKGGKVTDSLTVNFWLKSSTWANPVSCTESGGWNFESSSDYFRFVVYISGVGYKYGQSTTKRSELCNNQWHMLTGVYDRVNSKIKIYVDGELDNDYDAGTTNNIGYNANNVIWLGAEASSSATAPASNGMIGLFSDFRIYATALLDNDIKKLYNTSMSVNRASNDFIYELDENDSNRELMQGIHLTTSYNNHGLSNLYNRFNENGEPIFTANGQSMGSDYIYINPTSKTYYYDIELSCNAGNQFYIGFHRYDKNKTARSNNACVYIIATKPTSDIVHKRYFGTVNLSTDGTNPCDSISLRVLNGWSGTTSGVTGIATIHRFSLREVASLDHQGTMKNGILQADEFKEYEKASIYKNGIIEAGQFIER